MSARVAITDAVQDEIEGERWNQVVKFGQQNHDPATWLMILGEEVGEANKAALEIKFPPDDVHEIHRLAHYREELVQVAAVAIAMIESLDRNELRKLKSEKPLELKPPMGGGSGCDGPCGMHCLCGDETAY